MNPTEYVKPTAAEVKKRWQACVDDLLSHRRNYWLNESFFHGEQWVGYNDTIHELSVLPFDNNREAQHRTTVNKFKPRTVQFEARMLRTPLDFEPRPEGVDAEDIRRAATARQILAVEAHRRDWEQTRHDEIHYAMLGGVSAVAVEPDWDTESAPVPDSTTGEYVKMPKRPAVKYTAMSVVEFGIEPGSRSVRDARWWIRSTTLTPHQAQEHYQLDYKPTPDGQTAQSAIHRQLLSQRSRNNTSEVCLVYVLYERPCEGRPGCVVHVIGDRVVSESEWPFPWDDELNVFPFFQTRMSSTWKGDTILNDARQLQVNLNRAHTTINAHIGKADNARMLMPQGAMVDEDDELTGEVGEIIRFNQEAGTPSWMQPPQVPRWLREHIDTTMAELDDLFSAHAVSRGQAPGDRNSGLALSILAEKDETPLGIMVANQQRGWQWLAEKYLRLTKHLLDTAANHPETPLQLGPFEDVLIPRGDEQNPVQVRWSAADLTDHPIVHVPIESVMPRSQAAVQSMMVSLAQSFPRMFEGLDPGQLATVLQTPDPTAFTRVANPFVTQAEWENSRMVVGAEDEEIEIAEWHDHDIHVQKHNALRASSAYRNASPERKAYIDLHIDAHAKLAQQQIEKQMMQQMQMQMMQQQSPPADAGAEQPQPEVVPA
jgi:hypothetical protein